MSLLHYFQKDLAPLPLLEQSGDLKRAPFVEKTLRTTLLLTPLGFLVSLKNTRNVSFTVVFFLFVFLFTAVLHHQRNNFPTNRIALLYFWFFSILLGIATWREGGPVSPGFQFFAVLLTFQAIMFSATMATLFCALFIGYGMFLLLMVQLKILPPPLQLYPAQTVIIYAFQLLSLYLLLSFFLQILHQAFDALQTRKQELQASRVKAQDVDLLLHSMAESVLVLSQKGSIQYANPATLKMLGYTVEELLQKSWKALILPDDQKDRALPALATPQQIPEQLELEYRHKDGHSIPVLFSRLLIEEQNHIVCFARNLTQRKRIEKELQKVRRAAEDASLTKSNFLARMSHELRTPLNVIVGYSDMQREMHVTSNPDAAEELGKVLKASERLLQLINTTLDISRIEASKPFLILENYLLAGLLETVQKSCAGLEKTNQNEFVFSNNTSTVWVHGDPGKTRQILEHLLSNAFRYTSQGMVSLVAFEKEEDGVEGICFSVTDTGVGLSAEEQKNIFHQFVQSEKEGEQELTPLGLALSRKWARMMGGSLTVESQVDSGSTFRLWLPLQVVSTTSRDEIKMPPLPPL